jgi:hypothetical protein
MAAVEDVDELIERYHLALDEFMKGNPEPVKELFSHRGDATLTNPQGSAARGWKQVGEVTERAASTRRDGRFVGFEITPYTLRATMIFRPEDGEWKVVHRHADQITTTQPAEAIVQE